MSSVSLTFNWYLAVSSIMNVDKNKVALDIPIEPIALGHLGGSDG